MPVYQYRCTECGHEIERTQKFSDPALTTCEDCGGKLRKVYNAVGIVFKGSGFYATDNRTKGSAAAAAPASDSSSSSDTKAAPAKKEAAPSTPSASTSASSKPSSSSPSTGSAS